MLTKRSISIRSRMTSISLEGVFWDEIERQASLQGMAWQEYARHLVRDVDQSINRSSFIRKKVLLYLKDELKRAKGNGPEAWWVVRTPRRIQEIGTRSSILYAGRNISNDLIIDDESASRRHLMLCWDGEKWWAVDLNSKNQTFFKGQRIQVAVIAAGESLLAGDVEIMLKR